jgi:predicted DNA-binding transcriptional regulator
MQMSNDRTLGGVILVGSIGGVIIYFWLLFMSPWSWLTVQVSAFAAVAAVLLIIAWIGYTLATTPPPVPLEDLDLDSDFDDLEEEPEEEAEEEEEEDKEEG